MIKEKVIELVDIGVANMWGHFKDGVLRCIQQGWVGEANKIHGCGMRR